MRRFAQLMMHKTKVVAASDQIHASLKRSQTTSGMTRFARQAGQPFSKGAIQAFDKSRIEDRAPLRALEQRSCLLQHPMGHLSRDLDHPLFLGVLDDCPNVQLRPDLQARSPSSLGVLDLLTERSADAPRIGSPAVGQHQQRSQAGCAAANLGHQAVGQAAITRGLDHPCQPQARRNHHGQPHPCNHLVSFHSYFIGLNMHQVKFPLLDNLLMDLLAMLSCSVTPGCHRPFIQPEGMHNGLHRASIRQECYDDHNQLHRFAQPLKHRSLTGTERLFAHLTAIALSLAIMDRDLARTSLASCRTPRIRAKYVRRVHWLGCTCLHKHIMPGTVTFFNSPSLHRVVGSYQNITEQKQCSFEHI